MALQNGDKLKGKKLSKDETIIFDITMLSLDSNSKTNKNR
jgi:hypothetical protein